MKGKERTFLIVEKSYGAGFKLDKYIIRGFVKSDMYPSSLEKSEKYKGCDILEVTEDCYIKVI
jgi:hypothetical protein